VDKLALTVHFLFGLRLCGLHARLQLSLVQQASKDVAQVGAEILDATLAISRKHGVDYFILAELFNNLAHLLKASIQQKKLFIMGRHWHRSLPQSVHLRSQLYLMYIMYTRCANGKYIRHLLYILADASENTVAIHPFAPEKGASGED
jgi:hypothetical protein